MSSFHQPAERPGSPAVLRFPENEVGNDYIVGDLHGAYQIMVTALRALRFNPRADRLFCVGDLINRGEESMRAARFLDQPYVHACRGNHEDLVLQAYSNGPPSPELFDAMARLVGVDISWWHAADPVERDALAERFKSLPLAMEIQTSRGLVGVVHAEVPPGMTWPQFTAALEAGNDEVTQSALWGRKRIRGDDAQGVPGVDRLFVGHTIQWTGPRQLGNVFYIDTGAIFGQRTRGQEPGHLTVASILAKTASLSEVAAPMDGDKLFDFRVDEPEPGTRFGSIDHFERSR